MVNYFFILNNILLIKKKRKYLKNKILKILFLIKLIITMYEF
jgi:hypothetical protein